MITYLRGEVAAVYDGRVVLDVNGVGFQIFISTRDAADMPPVGEEIRIHTYMSVSEDAMRLYGFLSEVWTKMELMTDLSLTKGSEEEIMEN